MNSNYLNFISAKRFVRNFGIKNHSEWIEWSKTQRPENIPSNPKYKYKNEWVSWDDFLNDKYVNLRRVFISFEEAREVVRNAGLKNRKDWERWSKMYRPQNIPSMPKYHYWREWISWDNFLMGEEKKSRRLRSRIIIKR